MRGMPTHREKIEAPTEGMNDQANIPSIDSEPPIALDKFIEQSGCSAVTVWRYRRAGWLNTLNICGRHYLTRARPLVSLPSDRLNQSASRRDEPNQKFAADMR